MQDGDAGVISGSLKHCSLIDEVTRSHAQLGQSSYGQLVGKYGRLILDKLAFHSRNRNVPGNFSMKNTTLENIDAGDMFEICVEFLDQMEATAQLMKSIFASFEIGNKSFSLTTSGQCRLAALIPCTHDTSRLLELTTNLVRLLHLALPWETLDGHRTRFHSIHKELRKLYEDMSHILYLRSMVNIPRLAEDISHFFETLRSLSLPSSSPMVEEANFDMLRSQDDDTNSELVSVTDESVDASMAYIQQEYSDLSSRYQTVLQMLESEQKERVRQEQENLATIKQLKEESKTLRQHLSEVSQSDDINNENDEKLAKLKTAYQKLRTDHITILRQKADLDKKLIGTNAKEQDLREQLKSIKDELKKFVIGRGIEVSDDDFNATLLALGDKMDILQMAVVAKEGSKELEFEINKLQGENQTLLEHKNQLEHKNDVLKKKAECDAAAWQSEIQWKKHKLAMFLDGDSMIKLEDFQYNAQGICEDDHLLSYLLMALVNLMPHVGIDGISPDGLYPHIHDILESMNSGSSTSTISTSLNSIRTELDKQKLIADRNENGASEDDVEAQIQSMQNSINEAATAMEKLMLAARANEHKKKNIDVDLKILDSCSQLLSAIQQLIKEARDLQAEITEASGSVPKDFYRRNHKWTQGLISAAKDIGRGAKVLVETSDGVVGGTAKFEELIVASQEIAGSTGERKFQSSKIILCF